MSSPPKPPRTPQQLRTAEIRIYTVIALIAFTLAVLLLWAAHHKASKEAIESVILLLVLLGDLVLFILITIEPFYVRRKRKASAASAVPVPNAAVPRTSAALVCSVVAMMLSILLFVFAVGSHGGPLAFIVFSSISFLQVYRLVLLLTLLGAEEAWDRIKRWRLTHFHTHPE